jgi:hypothetical protein
VNYSLHRGAEGDLTEAFRFYRREAGNGLARRFLDEFERLINLIESFPILGAQQAKTAAPSRSGVFPTRLFIGTWTPSSGFSLYAIIIETPTTASSVRRWLLSVTTIWRLAH